MTIRSGLFVRKDGTKGTTPLEARLALEGIVPREGVMDGLVVSGRASWAYQVTAGHCVTRRSNDGVVLFSNDSTAIVGEDGEGDTVPPAPGTGSRIDIIYILHNDVDNDDPNSQPRFGVASGVAQGTPNPPTIPDGAIELARATVVAGATNTAHANVTITHSQRLRTGVRGGIITVNSNAERDALSSFATSLQPIWVDNLATGTLERNRGSSWVVVATVATAAAVPPFRMAAGVQALSVTTDSAVFAASLPAGRFTQAPVMTGNVMGSTSATAGARVRFSPVTTTDFQIIVTGLIAPTPPNSLTFSVAWTAVQMTPTTAAG